MTNDASVVSHQFSVLNSSKKGCSIEGDDQARVYVGMVRFASHEENLHENQYECKAGGGGGLLNYYYRKAAWE